MLRANDQQHEGMLYPCQQFACWNEDDSQGVNKLRATETETRIAWGLYKLLKNIQSRKVVTKLNSFLNYNNDNVSLSSIQSRKEVTKLNSFLNNNNDNVSMYCSQSNIAMYASLGATLLHTRPFLRHSKHAYWGSEAVRIAACCAESRKANLSWRILRHCFLLALTSLRIFSSSSRSFLLGSITIS